MWAPVLLHLARIDWLRMPVVVTPRVRGIPVLYRSHYGKMRACSAGLTNLQAAALKKIFRLSAIRS
jgi:hypothetical protein